MMLLLLLAVGAPPEFTVENKCPPAFVVVSKLPAPSPADRFTATDGTTYERCPDGFYRAVAKAPAVAVPQGAAFQSGGCGCTASANCGAPFCKSRGGTGCPQSCPVKQR